MKVKSSRVLVLATALLLIVAAICGVVSNSLKLNVQAETEENILYSEDFSSGVSSEMSEYLTVSNGVATIATNEMFDLPINKLVESNNYIMSFDLKKISAADLNIHFKGLNGTTGENIYFAEVGDGQFWKISDYNGHDVYNNSGDLHGGLNAMGVDLSETVNVKLVHFEGYVELYINGERRVVSHLSNFGNNNYVTRTKIEEGTISGFAIHSVAANALTIDNIKIIEAKGLETSFSDKNDSQSVSSSRIFNLTAQNLYRDNFNVRGTFVLANAEATGYFPTIKLFGMNNSIKENNQREYAINFQAEGSGKTLTPGMFWQLDGANPWSGSGGDPIEFEVGDEIEYSIEFYGDNIDFYINDVLSVSTTFTDIGIEKGKLQYIRIVSGAGGVYWKDFSYNGFESATAATISTAETLLTTGADAAITAELFGDKGEAFSWFVNDIEQPETSLTLTLTNMQNGDYEIVYKSNSFMSNKINISVIDRMIRIIADKPSAYPTETITVNAELVGDFDGDILQWFINNEASDESTGTLTLINLPAGDYVVKYGNQNIESNELKITVLQGVITIGTDKNGYTNQEKATILMETTGVGQDDTIDWFVNDEKIEISSAVEIELDLSAYQKGESISVHCESVSGIESNKLTLSIVYDVDGEIRNDENFKAVYVDEIKADGTYGNFSVGEDENGKYLFSEQDGGSTWYVLQGNKPTTTSFIMEYKLFVPSDINSTSFVYPCLSGLNSKFPAGAIETAVEVNSEGISPYFKDQNTNTSYSTVNNGLGKDLTYTGGISKKGDWNTITVAVKGSHITMYINGELAIFFKLSTATVPSQYSFNTFPDGGAGVVPVRIKDIVLYEISQPIPDLQSINISLSSVKIKVNEKVTAQATLNPHNAAAKVIKWFVNGKAVDGNKMTYEFSPTKAGTYSIYCEIDGIKSSEKSITVEASSQVEEEKSGCGSNINMLNILPVMALLLLSLYVIIKKRKKV